MWPVRWLDLQKLLHEHVELFLMPWTVDGDTAANILDDVSFDYSDEWLDEASSDVCDVASSKSAASQALDHVNAEEGAIDADRVHIAPAFGEEASFFDQKPVWFNNAGHTKNFRASGPPCATRARKLCPYQATVHDYDKCAFLGQ